MATQLVGTFENRWDAVWTMHCCDIVGSLSGGDGGDEKRPGAAAAVQVGCVSSLPEWVLRDADHWDILTGGAKVIDGMGEDQTRLPDGTPVELTVASTGQTELPSVVRVLWVDRRMSGPGIRVRDNAQGGGLTGDDWQRELQIAGIMPNVFLLSRMPHPPFRFDQVFDLKTGSAITLFLPGESVEIESGKMLAEICGRSHTFGRRIRTDRSTTETSDDRAADANRDRKTVGACAGLKADRPFRGRSGASRLRAADQSWRFSPPHANCSQHLF